MIYLRYGSSSSSWNPWRWVRLDFIFKMRDVYINSNLNPLTQFTSRNRSTELKDILPWSISKMIMKIVPISTRIVMSYAIKWGILFWLWQKKSMENETKHQHFLASCFEFNKRSMKTEIKHQHFWMGKSHFRTKTSIRKKK